VEFTVSEPDPTPAIPAAIDPAKAWMLGLVADADGTLRPARSGALSFGSALRSATAADGETLVCTCPDYCDLEHDAS
jgi:hypothetical protein